MQDGRKGLHAQLQGDNVQRGNAFSCRQYNGNGKFRTYSNDKTSLLYNHR